MKTLSIDIETFSDVDLSKCGVYKYASSPAFEVLLFGYAVDGGEVRVMDLACGEKIPADILQALSDETVEKWAFNAMFERVCLSHYLGEWLESEGWHCTMVWSATLGLPLSLENAGAVLGLEKQKLTEGKDLIRYFCVPCKPTKTNGGGMRNLPEHDREKWSRFKAYNLRDVEAEMQIQQRLSKFPVSDEVWEQYHQDQEINDRGIGVDMEMVEQAIRMDALSHERLSDAMKELTELDNPNSVQQMKHWLAENGMETDSLDKKAVAALLKTAPEPLAEVLELRQQLAKSSVKKYTAMKNAVCSDGRAHGMFQFYGANRTGRFSGRLVQLQNLPQNHMPDLAEARELVKCGDFDALSALYDSVPEVLSELIRTAFVPQDGRKFIVADFSAIEARVIAWLAGERWRIINAYVLKTGLSRARLSHLMDAETWMDANKAVELGFADDIMVRAKAEPEEESEEGDADGNLEEDEEKKTGKPPAADTSMLFSRRAVNNALLNKLEKHYKKPKPAAVKQAQISVPPDGQEHTENEGRPVSEIMERLSFIKKFI